MHVAPTICQHTVRSQVRGMFCKDTRWGSKSRYLTSPSLGRKTPIEYAE